MAEKKQLQTEEPIKDACVHTTSIFTHRPDSWLENSWYSHPEKGAGPYGLSNPPQCEETKKCVCALRLEVCSERKQTSTHSAELGQVGRQR